MENYYVPENLNVVRIDCKDAFNGLSENDKRYAYWFYKASWAGINTVAEQVSSESKDILTLVKKLFSDNKSFSKLDDSEDSQHFLNYWAYVCGNLGNYSSFGDCKFIPRISKEKMDELVARVANNDETVNFYNAIKNSIFSLESNEKILGFPPDARSGYFSDNLTEDEIKKVDRFMQSQNMEGWNTRLYKLTEDGDTLYVITIASADVKHENHVNKIHRFENIDITVSHMDHADEMKKIVEYLTYAKEYANHRQKNMLEHYIDHFRYGDIEDHKRSQMEWIKDVDPVVETNIGFIEHYRDPDGIRSEFEGFVAVVNKEQSKKYQELVDNAQSFVSNLPWDSLFEKDRFNKPDFTSLDVLAFCSSGCPIGINIPNYDDIRMTQGFKNVSLGNVMSAMTTNFGTVSDFIPEKDREMYKKHGEQALSIQVATHELLGHGSGKLFYKDNYDDKSLEDFLADNPKYKNGHYEKGETWSSKFGTLASTYEECRAESCALYFATDKKITEIFNVSDEDFNDVLYAGWLSMMIAAVRGTQSFNVEKKKWQQAHSQARFVIYKVLKRNGFVNIKTDNDKIMIEMDKDRIMTDGKRIIGDFLKDLQIHKSTANFEAASKMYSELSELDDEDMRILNIYDKIKKPRPIIVQPTITNDLEYVDYEPNAKGVIESFCCKY